MDITPTPPNSTGSKSGKAPSRIKYLECVGLPQRERKRCVARGYRKAHSKELRENQAQRRANWSAEQKARDAQLRAYRALKRKYGVTPEDVEGMRVAQGDRCMICQKKRKLVVDHNHNTNKVRGLLCSKCNIAVGLLDDSVAALSRAVEYVRNG